MAVEELNEELTEEYDASFTEEEKISHILKITSNGFQLDHKTIKISTIGYTKPIQIGRQETISGLTATIKDLGVVNPIHVMKVPEESADEDYQYVLLDGFRRVYGALKNGQEEIDAVIWDFEDKDKGMDIALIITLLLNRVQRRTINETWELYKILELQDSFTPATLEYLLQLEGGDAMKLKDVMLCEYEEVIQACKSGEKTLDQCYKMLQKLRKEENQLEKDDVTGVSDISEDASTVTSDNTGERGTLSDQDVRELLEMADNLDNLGDVSSEDFSDLNAADSDFVENQKVGERHPLDPALRNAVLARDDFTCACCGMRMVGARLGLIAVHHKIPVHTGYGKDTMENLVTLCVNDHLTLHIIERNGGTIMMSEEDFNKLTENEQTSLKKARQLALVAIEADKRKGLSKKDIQDATQDAIRHPMPGAGMKGAKEAYIKARNNHNVNSVVVNDDNDEDDFDLDDFEE